MTPVVPGPHTDEPFGFPMELESCLRYIETFPGSFECVR